jgi:hypothetical protein
MRLSAGRALAESDTRGAKAEREAQKRYAGEKVAMVDHFLLN